MSAGGQARDHCVPGNKDFCSIRLLAKAEAEELAANRAHEKEAGGAWNEIIHLVPGLEHLVETGSGALAVSGQQLLLNI